MEVEVVRVLGCQGFWEWGSRSRLRVLRALGMGVQVEGFGVSREGLRVRGGWV
jgi:hypothetical protein